MGSTQSSPAVSTGSPAKGSKFSGGRGRKTSKSLSTPGLAPSFVSLPSEILRSLKDTDETHNTFDDIFEDDDVTIDDEEYDASDSEDESEDTAEWEERIRILEDAKNLKKVAEYYLHPEKPVEADACARCFFDRPSAPSHLAIEEADDRAMILEEAALLKKFAVDFMHPELPVVTSDPTACGRNYFTRVSAPPAMDYDERAAVLADAKKLKALAVDYMHPELPVTSNGSTARCYFDRASAPTMEDGEERSRIMDDLKALKQAAKHYLHPELPVETMDPTACARCYFDRASAYHEDLAITAEREAVLQDAAALKQLAVDYLHPEKSLQVDPLSTARCYFDRASAPEQESVEESEARAELLEDCYKLKSLAVDYLHPEIPVVSNGSTARCYFDRASAPEQIEDLDERAAILEDAKAMKKLAIDYMHPELPVTVSDPTCTARCYFDRPSAQPRESAHEIEERELILEEAKALRKLAMDYLHPELPVRSSTASRCYFDRASAAEQLSLEEAEERARILEDAKALKGMAVDYLHPELPVVVADATATARCYFDRFSAPAQKSLEEIEMHDQVLADAASLKKLAVDYMHPEAPLACDPSAMARCYFGRFSAEVGESKEDADEIARIIADAKALKHLAVDYMHPELPVKTSDPSASGRCYFDRPAARLHNQMIHTFPAHEDDDHSDHHDYGDHFGMDEDLDFLHQVSDKLTGTHVNQTKISAGDEEESNLSRSPSSVMLFTDEPIYE